MQLNREKIGLTHSRGSRQLVNAVVRECEPQLNQKPANPTTAVVHSAEFELLNPHYREAMREDLHEPMRIDRATANKVSIRTN